MCVTIYGHPRAWGGEMNGCDAFANTYQSTLGIE